MVDKGKQLVPFSARSAYPEPVARNLLMHDPLKKVYDLEHVAEFVDKLCVSDGTTASYYELPPEARELQDVISYKNMNSQIGEVFRACMRYGEVEHSSKLRDINKILFYAREEKKRLERYENE